MVYNSSYQRKKQNVLNAVSQSWSTFPVGDISNMTAVYQTPTKVHLTSSATSSSNSSTHHSLYRQITPRKKIDRFGIDQTNYTSYLLSSTVFPTGVKTKLLAQMQEVNPHKCGFDIVEKPRPEGSVISTFIHAPPPTAEQSKRGSMQSAPIVAFVEKSSSTTSGERRGSINSKITINSKSQSDDLATPRERHDVTNKGKLTLVKQNMINANENGKMEHINEFEDDVNRDKLDDETLDRMAKESIKKIKARLEAERRSRSLKSSKLSKSASRVAAFSSCDAARLLSYNWRSRESRVAEDRKDGGDIRDPMYLNTFFPEERPVRYQKMSLPRITRTNRNRPWTVSEANVSARASAMTLAQKSQALRSSKSRAIVTRPKDQKLRASQSRIGQERIDRAKPKIGVNLGSKSDVEDEEDGQPLLDIRPFLANSAVEDQRDKLKGMDGCLNSRVKQCVRFVRYRERLDKQGDNRPLKTEAGKYRPFSKTDVREHNIANPPPTPEAKLQKSVETYQKYVDTIAMQTKMSSPKPFTFRGSNNSSRQLTATTSSAIDTDSLVVQSVMDSNMPDSSNEPSRASDVSPRPQNSAIYTKDVSGMNKALDIKRLSPKVSTTRIVAGTRSLVTKEPSPRYPSASTDEGVDMRETTTNNAIVVPLAAKSECASEYSSPIGKED